MDIYKITDEIPEESRGKKRNSGAARIADKTEVDEVEAARKLKITNLKQGIKNPNRVNVFVNDKFSFSLDISQVVELGVKVGLVVTPEKIAEYRQASEYGKMYQRALEWVLTRPRSERELRDYLFRKYRDTDYSAVIKRLVAKGYVDDRRFAEFWVENRFVKKGVSRRRLMMELQQKGIARDIIEEVIDGRDETEEIRKMVARKKSRYTDEKLMQYLCRQGFSYDNVRKILNEEKSVI